MTDTVSILPHLLARQDDDWWVKLIPLAILIGIWAIVAVASQISKANKNPAPGRSRAQGPRYGQGSAGYSPPPVLRTINSPPPRTPPPAIRPRLVPAPPPLPPGAAARRPVAPPPVPLADQPPPARQTQRPTPSPVHGRQSLSAAAIRRWLTPQVLRRQYIVTEVFDPPPGLRESEP